MKKLIFLCFSLLASGILFQACDNTKTYAEMLQEEKDAISKLISDSAFHVISESQFEANGNKTAVKGKNGATYDEFVSFSSNGVYMQIVDGALEGDDDPDKFVDGDEICTRYAESNILTGAITCFNVVLEGYEDYTTAFANPLVFRYVESSSYLAGTITGMDYLWSYTYSTTAVPQGWLVALPYIHNGAHVRLIVPSKMGHSSAQQYVTPYFYDIWKFSKAES